MNGGVTVKVIKKNRHEAVNRVDIRRASVFAGGNSVKCPVTALTGKVGNGTALIAVAERGMLWLFLQTTVNEPKNAARYYQEKCPTTVTHKTEGNAKYKQGKSCPAQD